MSAKRKKIDSSWPKRVYTTKKLREMAEQNRSAQEEVARRNIEPQVPHVAPEVKLVPEPPIEIPENKPAPPPVKNVSVPLLLPATEPPIPTNALASFLVLILFLITFFVIVSSKFAHPWLSVVVATLNVLIIHGGFIILSVIQGGCALEGGILKTHYYKVSLQGDWLAFYSLELPIIFAVLFAFFQKITWIKKGMIFICLVSLAIMANILRVTVAFGLALNYGAAYADRCFYGGLVGFVFIFIILGLIFVEFLFSPD